MAVVDSGTSRDENDLPPVEEVKHAEGFGKLRNLQSLDLEECYKLEALPEGFAR